MYKSMEGLDWWDGNDLPHNKGGVIMLLYLLFILGALILMTIIDEIFDWKADKYEDEENEVK